MCSSGTSCQISSRSALIRSWRRWWRLLVMLGSRKRAGDSPMSSDGVAIRVRNLSKHYQLYDRPEDRLKQSIVPRLQRLAGVTPTTYGRSFQALDDVTFE